MFVGLDIHKKHNQACVMDEKGEIIKEERFLNTKEELDAFLESIPDDSKIVMEACSVWEPIFEEIEEQGFDVCLAHPAKVRLIAEARVKTDKIDAEALAHLLRVDMLPKAYVPPENMRKLRSIIRHRIALVKLRGKVKNMVHSVLHKSGITIELSDIFGLTGMKFLREVPLKPEHRFAMSHYIDLVDKINGMIEETNKYIDVQAAKLPEIPVLRSIPGIGTYSALLLYAEIGEISRFHDSRKLCSYAGVTASVYQSGEKARYGHMTKKGSSLIRWVLIQAIPKTIRKCKELKAFHDRIEYKKGNNVAKVASARKLLVYIHVMLTHNIQFGELRVNSV